MMDKKKTANNILDLLVDPTRIPVRRRLYFHPEEKLNNRILEEAKEETYKAYGDQKHNSDMYPIRNRLLFQKEAMMDRRTMIASLDILAQNFHEQDPIAKDLRVMAEEVSKLSDENFEGRVIEDMDFEKLSAKNPWMEHMKKVRKENPDKSLKELIQIAKKTYKKAEEEESSEAVEAKKKEEKEMEDKWSKEASDSVKKALLSEMGFEEKKAGKIKGPGKPDGTGPRGGTPECPMSEEEEEKKTAGKKKGPGKPDGTGPYGGTSECQMSEEKEKEAEDNKEAQRGIVAPVEGPQRKGPMFKQPTAPNPQQLQKYLEDWEEAVPSSEKSKAQRLIKDFASKFAPMLAPAKAAAEEEEEDKDSKCPPKKEAGKDYETEPGRQPQEEGDIEEEHKEKKSDQREEEEEKKAEVNTDMLATEEFEGIEINNPLIESEDLGELSSEEQDRLNLLFK